MSKVFMVEDDNLLIHIYEKVFKSSGFEIEFAYNGEEAIDKLNQAENMPSIIVLDIMMPKKDGFEVLKEIKDNPKLKSIPVVILTNLFGEEQERKGINMGAVTYLVKSKYVPSEIVAKVKEIIAKYSAK